MTTHLHFSQILLQITAFIFPTSFHAKEMVCIHRHPVLMALPPLTTQSVSESLAPTPTC